ncbi:glycosyltransferase family 2 protein [Methylocaldum sp.]|uniref:glycosyltransferase family 2 protein n=1 Tax=Methylocaldum sp. TaxID=1969727 RepID=UPI002D6D72D5|nr:glycosyltransferase family 2 protein [Methylocaldum sp.]HYE37786.1 glycosyltransferase family 2 protein [Methylocaldum sp.]
MTLPKITIITPSYNQGLFLEQCIDSVLDQNYSNLEYFIFDGGSTDKSVEVIRKYQQHLSYWISESDEGQSDAINKGFKRANGDIVAWLNADDYYLPGAFDLVSETYKERPDAAFYFGNGLRVTEERVTKGSFFPVGRVQFNLDALVFGLNYILQPAVFINHTYLLKAGLLDPALHYGMDTDLWIRLAHEAPPVAINRLLAASREYSNTKTATGGFERIEELRQIAQKHSGMAFTPGVLCYFLDTLHQFSREHEDIFPQDFRHHIESFWGSTSQLLKRYGATQDGFPEDTI